MRLLVDITGGMGGTFRVVMNGALLGEAMAVDSDAFHFELDVVAPALGEDRYRVEVVEERRPVTITSHVYVRRPAGGGGCAVLGGARAPALTLLGLALGLAFARSAARARRRP